MSISKVCACAVIFQYLFWYFYGMKWRRKWQPTPVFLPGKSHGWRTLVGYSPWGRKELDKTEQLHFHFQLYSLIIYTLSKNVEGDLHIHLNN